MARRPNILLITLDQFRGDSLSCAGHPVVRTPHLDRLVAEGVRLARHYSQAAPCSPGRAALYTGTYQMNNRVADNGSPLDARFDNVALAARRAGYAPALFGYTDQSVDPRTVTEPDDPRLSSYEGILPGFDAVVDLSGPHTPWLDWLRELGHPVGDDPIPVLATEPDRPAEHSVSAFLTSRAIDWIGEQDGPWFAHLSYLRPHPPYAAAGHWATAYDPADVGLPIPPAADRHPMHDVALHTPGAAAPTDPDALRAMRAQYYGMISEVDDQLGRLWEALVRLGGWDDTVVVVTADHAEMLGDHGLQQKLGFWESSYHIVGIVRDPGATAAPGSVVDAFTENVDIMPTLCQMMGLEVPVQCDGLSLLAWTRPDAPAAEQARQRWRDAAHWEYDWRSLVIRLGLGPWPDDRRAERCNLAVLRSTTHAYVHFADGSWRCFDLVADATWRTEATDPAVVVDLAQRMLTWRATHLDRTLADSLVERGGIGRLPAGLPRTVTSAPAS